MRSGSIAALLAVHAASLSGEFGDTYAIVGAKVEVGNGTTLPTANVIVYGGRIVAVGSNAAIPSHAKRIDGKGLTVLPGFIDAYATGVTSLPAAGEDPDLVPERDEDAAPTMRLGNRKVARAQWDAADFLSLSAERLFSERAAGFTTLVAAPTGDLINGTSAIVDLNGLPRRESLVATRVAVGMAFRASSRDGYPGSLMGTQAYLRQALMDATDPNLDPVVDPVLTSLSSQIRAKHPIFFEADSEQELFRAQNLVRPYTSNVVLVGATEAYRATPNAPLVVSVNFGPDPATLRDDTLPPSVREDRIAKFKERVGNLAVLAKGGKAFALTGRGTRDRAEFWRNVRRAVAAGCPRSAVLAGLTSVPARLLKIPDRGTVEAGKVANLAIFSGDFLAESPKLPYVMVRGKLFRPDRDRPPARPPAVPRDELDCGCMAGTDHDPHNHGGVAISLADKKSGKPGGGR